jgi:plasmid stabilization system protein ParE
MPQKAWSDKRERQYEHIKESYEDRGVSNDEAEERAARTVNKERAEHGETKSQKSRRT